MYFNVVQFDETDWYNIPGDLSGEYDSVVVRCHSRKLDNGQCEWIVTLMSGNEHGPDTGARVLQLSQDQAVKIAAALLGASSDAKRHQKHD